MSNDWDRAYDNRGAVADADDWIAAWQADGEAFRRAHESRIHRRAYGLQAREFVDYVEPADTQPQGTLVFVHGGYWRSMAVEANHQLAAGPLARGWRVAFIEYPLCPDVSLESLCDSVLAAIGDIADRVDGDLTLAGHSAGGHLVTHAVTEHAGLPDPVRARIQRVISISGLHDLRALARTTDIGGTLALDEGRAAALSPALARPAFAGDLLCVVGADELPELRRQSHLLANIWTGLGQTTAAHEIAGEHHFSIIEALRAPNTALTRWTAPKHLSMTA
ncbi:alpha/beta hydrolase [Salinisphaera sp. Q1T1-3]|uniref:alpha/beta hydrolase n=1 Tax=Salinisphaera sp. Q1T1-3 TaxID=2321229 RepID=UPI000E77084F|nr:alpha/beta hydrolase fold domain-containing protein [Salinisphaera sp. Q1T1-3]RJS94143.1 alpha/beta hydrolase [Salinisphaera sp. Q1T1-3]